MKNLGLFLAFIVFTFISLSSFVKGEFVTIKIKTSSQCEMCKETIEKKMAFEKGVKSAVLDVESSVLTVVYNPKKTNPDLIKKAVNMAGYDADEMPADPKSYDKLHSCCKKGTHK
tara:strand:- start:13617 stop:13961 length:345 start_codon:yes stop_codon:yes gene_type:complete